MRKTLYCSACDAPLSRALEIRSGKNPTVREPMHEDGKPLTEAGVAFKAWEPIERSYADKPALLEFTPQYWLNPADLTDTVRLARDQRRLSGCCGLAGTDGPNQLCRCGAEIGTLRTDCWTPLVFVPRRMPPAGKKSRHRDEPLPMQDFIWSVLANASPAQPHTIACIAAAQASRRRRVLAAPWRVLVARMARRCRVRRANPPRPCSDPAASANRARKH